MAKFEIFALLLVSFVFGTLVNPAASKRNEGNVAEQPEAELTVSVNGEQALLICGGDPTQVERRRRISANRKVQLHAEADEACQALALVEDLTLELRTPPPGSDPCILQEQDLQEAKIEGRFKGKEVKYRRSFRNMCQLMSTAPELFGINDELMSRYPDAEGVTFYTGPRYGG